MRQWTRSDEQRDQDDRMPILPHENGRPVMDERLHESLDNDDFQSQSPADRRASLKRVSEQLMLAWAQECPGLADDFQRIDERIDVLDRRSRGIQFEDGHRDENTMQKVSIVSRHDAHVHQGEYMALGATAAPTKEQAFGIPGLSQSDGQVASQGRDPVASLYGYPAVSQHGDPMVSQYGDPAASLHSGSAASRYVEASGYPMLEPDVGSMNIFTPNLRYGQSLNSILQPCSSSVTSVTTTYSLGRPVMSSHVAKQTRPQLSEGRDDHGRGIIIVWANLAPPYSLHTCGTTEYGTNCCKWWSV